MVRSAFIASLIVTIVLAFVSPCPLSARRAETDRSQTDRSMSHITIRIGDRAFAATLLDSATAAAFKKLLPLSLTMTELNGNEKFARLPVSLPTRESRPPSIQTGDLMLYGSNTVVLFYESFPTTYTYSKIGQVDDHAGLKAVLGSGNPVVIFEINRQGQ
jgi:hypothetical protein